MADEGIERAAELLDNKRPPKKSKKPVPPAPAPADGSGADTDNYPTIQHRSGELPESVSMLGAALAVRGHVYVHAGRLVVVHVTPERRRGNVNRPRGAVILHPVTVAHLIELAGRAAIHERWDARAGEFRRCDCPRRVAEAYMARGHWPELPLLSGIIEAPTITLDGRLIDTPGYDPDSGLFLAWTQPHGYTSPPLKSTRAAADDAVTTLVELFSDFAMISDADRAAMVAAIIAALCRRSLPAAPMLGITAPTPGSGKTMLAETISVIATGRRPSMLSLGQDDAETEKRLAGVLAAGDPCILIDNVERPLKGDLLCQVLTQLVVLLRLLGNSAMLAIPTHAFFVATGNNLSIIGDLKRRVMMVRLDAGVERPELRRFERDHLADVFAFRGELIRAALTIPLAYLAAGEPELPRLPPYGGYREWDRFVRRPLVWLGMPDPLQASESLREQDPDLEGMRALLSGWYDAFGDRAVTAAEVVEAGMETTAMHDRRRPEIYEALQLVCVEKPNARRLGIWLRRHRDRIVNGVQVRAAEGDKHAKVARWRVVRCG